MIGRDEVCDIIARLCGYYPRSAPPPNDDAVLAAWIDHFSQYPKLSVVNVRAGIRAYTNDPSHEFFPAPAAISRLARDNWNDRFERARGDNQLVKELYAAGTERGFRELN
jgi:hypothetical protein